MNPDRFQIIFQKLAEAGQPQPDGSVTITDLAEESSEIDRLREEWSQCTDEGVEDPRIFWRS